MEFRGVIFDSVKMDDREIWQDLPSELKSFYTEINGIVAYRGGLHIRGCVSGPDWHSLRYFWKGPKALYRQFASLRENDIPFAEDCLGDQYFWRLGTVWRLGKECKIGRAHV